MAQPFLLFMGNFVCVGSRMIDKFSWDAPFRAEDFKALHIIPDNPESRDVATMSERIFGAFMADIANARFKQLLKEHGVKVYAYCMKMRTLNGIEDSYSWSVTKMRGDTHEAVLIDVRKL